MLFAKKKSPSKYSLHYLFACLSALLVLSSCEDPNELGLALVEDNVQGNFIDTLTLDVSTVLLDSVATSGTSTLLVGKYNVPNAGTLMASTFFQVGLGATWTLAADATFESIELILPTSGYYYGDTAAALTVDVNEVTSTLRTRALSPVFPNEEPRSLFYQANAIYNNSKVAVAATPLATHTFTPRPLSKDTVIVSLADELGQQWLALRKADNASLTDNAAFLTYFRGLNIAPVQGNAVIGFSSTPVVRLNYSETVNGARVAKSHDFPLNNTSVQFNKITNDFAGSPLEGIKRGEELSAQASNGVSVAQGGSGLMIKVEIPHLNRLKEQLKPEFINQAVLIVEPLAGSQTAYPYPVPPSLALYRTNENNVPIMNVLADFGSTAREPQPLIANFIKSTTAGQNNRYEFIITEYIVDKLNDARIGTDNALFIAPPPSAVQNGVSRLVIGAQDKGTKNIRLKIYYTTIK
ncbi:DUF4270 family protein [Pontibacter akesuensis]|nr:DUF4270 family protein [Pontibacter akesuensis]